MPDMPDIKTASHGIKPAIGRSMMQAKVNWKKKKDDGKNHARSYVTLQ